MKADEATKRAINEIDGELYSLIASEEWEYADNRDAIEHLLELFRDANCDDDTAKARAQCMNIDGLAEPAFRASAKFSGVEIFVLVCEGFGVHYVGTSERNAWDYS